MHRLCGPLLLCFLPLVGAFGQDSTGTSTVTLSAGGETPTRNLFGESSGPVFNGNYEFRILKYLAVEAGVDNMLPRTQQQQFFPIVSIPYGVNLLPSTNTYVLAFSNDRTRSTFLPFGVRGILPVSHGRIELFSGVGGAYVWNQFSFNNAWLAQVSVGGRVALDQKRHFWVGTTGRFFTNFGHDRQEWLSWTADLGLRFGR